MPLGAEPWAPTMHLCRLPRASVAVLANHGSQVLLSPVHLINIYGEALVAQRLKRLRVRREIQVQSLGREDALEQEMATLSSTLAWKIPWTEEPGRLQSTGSQRVGHDFTFTFFHFLLPSQGTPSLSAHYKLLGTF